MTTNNPLLKIVVAEYVRDYTLRLTFNTGEVRLVDFTPLMQKGICRKLQDLDTSSRSASTPSPLTGTTR